MRFPRPVLPLSLTFTLALTGTACAETPASQPTTAVAAPIQYGVPITVPIAAGKFVEIPNEATQIRAYWVQPEGKGPFPGIVIAHEIYGITPFIKKQADSLAAQGYAVIVPDLYSRQKLPDTLDSRSAYVAYQNMPDQQVKSDLNATINYLQTAPEVGETQPLAIVGYDMGGIYAMLMGCSDLRLKCAVNYYGAILYPQFSDSRPMSPAEAVFNLRVPLLSFYGASDPAIPAAHISQLNTRLKLNPNHAAYNTVVLPGIGHGFADESRAGYNAAAAQEASEQTKAFLAKILRAAPPKPEE